ncbi:MAG: DUF6049 family protein, partial [Ilumatobacter fluminis]
VVQVRAHASVASRAEVDAVDDGDPGPISDIVQFDLDDVARVDEATGDRIVDLEIELTETGTDFDRLDLTEAGVYPLTVQIRRDGRIAADHTTFIEVLDTSRFGRGPLTYAVFAAIDDFGPTPTEAQLDDARTQLERVAELVDAVDGPVTLSLPPTVVTEFVATEPAAIERLQAALGPGDLLLALPDVELDPSSAASVDLVGTFTDRVVVGEELLTRTFPGVPIARSAWPVTTDITPDGAATLRDLGIPLLVVSQERYLEFDDNIGAFVDTTLLSGAELPDRSLMRMIIVDAIDERLAGDVDDRFNATERAVRVMAGTGAVRYGLEPDLRGMVLTAPDLSAPDGATLAEVERFVGSHPELGFDAISRLSQINTFFVDHEPHTVQLDAEPPFELEPRVDRAGASRLLADDTTSMLPTDDERPTEWETSLQLAMSTGLTSVEADSIITAVDDDIASVRAAVLPPEAYQFTIAGRQADVPVRIENTGSTPMTVVVRLTSDKLSVPGGDVTAVLAPGDVTDVVVPVETRSNGLFPVMVEVRTPVGNLLTEPVEMTARVTSLSGLGRVVTVGALLVLLSWWYSYFRRRRAETMAAASSRHPSNGDAGVHAGDEHDDEHGDQHDGESTGATDTTDTTGADERAPAWPGRLRTNGSHTGATGTR